MSTMATLDAGTDVAILCVICFENGNWDQAWPDGACGHERHWAVAEVGDGDEDWEVTWLVTGLDLIAAQEYAAELPGRILG